MDLYSQEIQWKKKRIYKINPKQLENSNRNIYIKNKFKCCKQKTQTG